MWSRGVSIAVGIWITLAAVVLVYAVANVHRRVGCPEDAALFWDGDAHTICLSLDDIPGWSDAAWEYIGEMR